jgi:hypothetical protein
VISDEDYRERAVAQQRPAYRTPAADQILRILVEPLQEVAEEIRQLHLAREQGLAGSEYAVAEYGGRINERRAGRTLEQYIRAIQTKIARLNSNGLPEDLLAVLRLLVGRPVGSVIRQQRGGGFHVFLLEDVPVADQAALDELGAVMEGAASAGKRVIVRAGTDLLDDSFRFGAFAHAASTAAIGASTITIYPDPSVPSSGWVHPAGSPVTAYTLSGITMTLAAPLVVAVTARDQVPLVLSSGAPLFEVGTWGTGTWWSSSG